MRNIKSIDYISKIFETITPSMRYDGKEDFSDWQKRAYDKLWDLLSLDKMVKCDDDDFLIESKEHPDGYEKIRFSFQTEPGLYTPCYALIPDNTEIKGVVICIQGHSKGMHISIGEPRYEGEEEYIASRDSDFARRAIKEGYVAIAMEQRYMGESGCDQDGSPACLRVGRAQPTLLLGRCAIGERVWDVMRLIDVIEKYFPEYSGKKLICLGNSGGGTTTFYSTCIDKRIDCGVPSCAVCTYKDSIVDLKHCPCNYIPGIGNYFDMGDIAGLAAPRKLVIVNGKIDSIFPDAGVQKTFAIAKDLFKAAGCEDNCRLVTGPEGHRFYADPAWEVINELMD
ncbi:MAG: hypothetical protein IKW02_01735 [Clostridia bacterium]|nr:hypothetical protein [Clostridia bacterium]